MTSPEIEDHDSLFIKKLFNMGFQRGIAEGLVRQHFATRQVEDEKQILLKRTRIFTILEKVRGKTTEEEVTMVLDWLTKFSKYVPITSEAEMEELVILMVSLGTERSNFPSLYDVKGVELMPLVREAILRYTVVISELRGQRKEFISYWWTDDAWMRDWAHTLLGMTPSDSLGDFGLPDVTVRDILHLLMLELACADSASRLDAPMFRLKPIDNAGYYLVPTAIGAKQFVEDVKSVSKGKIELADWVRDLIPTPFKHEEEIKSGEAE